MFPLIYGLVLFASQGWLVLSSPAKYDQRQEGDVNVQIDLKDVKIVTFLKSDLFDDYSLDEYVYDEAEFTIKPIMKPTTKPPETTTSIEPSKSTTSSSTTKNEKTESDYSTTSATTNNDNQSSEHSTISAESATEGISITSKIDDKIENKFGEITNVTEEVPSSTTESLEEKQFLQNQRQTKRCKGFDKSGRCLRRRISFLPIAMKIAPALVRSVRKRISI